MKSAELENDFISLCLELCPAAIVAYVTKTLALSSICGGREKNLPKPNPIT